MRRKSKPDYERDLQKIIKEKSNEIRTLRGRIEKRTA